MARRTANASSVAALADWALSHGCRRKKLLQHVGESRPGGCDPQQEAPCDWCRDREVRKSLSWEDDVADAHVSAQGVQAMLRRAEGAAAPVVEGSMADDTEAQRPTWVRMLSRIHEELCCVRGDAQAPARVPLRPVQQSKTPPARKGHRRGKFLPPRKLHR